MKALVLVKFASLATREAYRLLKANRAVTGANMVYGRYDAFAFIQAGSLDEIRSILLSEIQPIPGVVELLPCIIVEEAAQAAGEAEAEQAVYPGG